MGDVFGEQFYCECTLVYKMHRNLGQSSHTGLDLHFKLAEPSRLDRDSSQM